MKLWNFVYRVNDGVRFLLHQIQELSSIARVLIFFLYSFVYNIVFYVSLFEVSFFFQVDPTNPKRTGLLYITFSRNFSLDSGEFVISFIVCNVLQIQIDGEVVKDPNTVVRFS